MKRFFSYIAPPALPVLLVLGINTSQSLPDRATDEAAVVDSLHTDTEKQAATDARIDPKRLPPLPPRLIDTETLWLARGIYSESKRPEEQELVAWVIRNRVETGYRGQGTYHSVVLEPYQFSAFNRGDAKRPFYSSLTVHNRAPGWQRALRIAHHVRHADASLRPFPITTRHFFSERSMVSARFPDWAAGHTPVNPSRDYDIDARRFRFYAGVS